MKTVLGFDPNRPLVVITGGGLGAGHLNEVAAERLEPLLELASILLLSGTAHYDEMRALTPHDDVRFQLLPFINSEEMVQALGAADIVVSRAGATTILELSALAKPTVLIPAAQLTAGHQLKNAAEYAKNGAVEVTNDQELAAKPQVLVDMIDSLLADSAKRKRMANVFHAYAKPNATREVADLIERAAKKKR
jgi:UDP-N-acetylglucosamine--N-acetylmuramyl-(pentapeptide) pyrophosphoryl-undecaprenol N-acetylglucosamine transferase